MDKITLEKDTWESLNAWNCKLLAQNESLQSELDKTIKQLKDYEKTLKDYADMSNWFVCYFRHHFIFKKDNYKANELAKEILKKWEVK